MSKMNFIKGLIVIFCALFAFEASSSVAFHCLLGDQSAKNFIKTSISDSSHSQSSQNEHSPTSCLSHFCSGHSSFIKEKDLFLAPFHFEKVSEFLGSSRMILSEGFSNKLIRPPIC